MVLAHRQQLGTGASDAPGPIERVTGVPAPPEGLLLDSLADQVELGPGQRDDVKRVHPTMETVYPNWGKACCGR